MSTATRLSRGPKAARSWRSRAAGGPSPGVTEEALLAAWEAGAYRSPAERALAMAVAMAAATPAAGHREPSHWTPGRRDAILLDLHEAVFGGRFAGLVACPECGEQLEVAFHADDIRVETGDPAAVHQLAVEETGHRVAFRLPDSVAVAAATAHGDADAARLALVEHCVVRVEREGEGETLSARSLPETAIAALGAAIARLDPQADVRLALTCPSCDHRWSAPFDVADFVWREVDERARTLLDEVAALATAFGWSESEILGLSAARRRHYLELVGA